MPARKPEECDALFEKYLNEGNLDALVDIYEPEATLLPAPGQVATGHAAIRETLGQLISLGAKLKLTVTQTVVAGDIAVTYNDWSGQAGEMQLKGRAMEITRRQPDGTWRFVIDDPNARS